MRSDHPLRPLSFTRPLVATIATGTIVSILTVGAVVTPWGLARASVAPPLSAATAAPAAPMPLAVIPANAEVIASLGLSMLFGALDKMQIDPEQAEALARLGLDQAVKSMEQVTSAAEARTMLEGVKTMLSPEQMRQFEFARRQLGDGLDRLDRSQKLALYKGIADALPGVLNRHPHLKHFAPALVEELGVDWRDIERHLTRELARDIDGGRRL
ncbi:MAG: hypothetical protein AAF213_10855 [Pseudomonadota bacterium]